jgi:hypothetical protein
MDLYYKWRNAVIRFFYVWFMRPVLFLIDAEQIHIAFLKIGDFLGKFGLTKWGTGIFFDYKNSQLHQNILKLRTLSVMLVLDLPKSALSRQNPVPVIHALVYGD